MGQLIDGVWHDTWYDTKSTGGKFQRSASAFRNWLTADGAPGPTGTGGFIAEKDRYHLYVSLACPWAHRTLIMRKLKGLEPFISVSVVNPLMLEKGMELARVTDRRRALMLGDSLTSDMAAAGNAGVDACWFNPKGAANDRGVPIAYEIASLDEVDAILDGTEE